MGEGSISAELAGLDRNHFLLLIFDRHLQKVIVVNDKFATNEILYYIKDKRCVLGDDVHLLASQIELIPKVNNLKAKEFLLFACLTPPETIYEEFFSIPAATLLEVDLSTGDFALQRYWDFEPLFSPKIDDYETLLQAVKKGLQEAFAEETMERFAVALSGGIDSGGLLGWLTALQGKKVTSISVGPWGRSSLDLKKAECTAQHTGSIHYKLYPDFQLKKLPTYLKFLNQPIDAGNVLGYSMIFEKARDLDLAMVVTGHGTQAMLGCVTHNKLAYYLNPIEKLIPFTILRPLYALAALIGRFSPNRTDILLTPSWTERHIKIISPFRSYYERSFLRPSQEIYAFAHRELNKIYRRVDLDLVDRIVFANWHFFHLYDMQTSLNRMSQKYGISTFMPFYTPKVAAAILKTPNSIRKLNGWDKKLIRDLFRGYVPREIYTNPTKSLVIPFEKILGERQKLLWRYLNQSPLLQKIFDVEHFEKEYACYPCSAFLLMRLVGLALWYDANWHGENVSYYHESLFEASSQSA